MNQKLIIIFILFITLASCDCQYHLTGIVLDKQTNKPIKNVAIGKTDTTDLDNPFNSKTMTKINGYYTIYGVSGRCNDITMFFTKEGYETQTILFRNNSSDTIFLEPIHKPEAALFDPNQEFIMLEITESNDHHSTKSDTSKCNDWTLGKLDIQQIFTDSKLITGPEWHHMFGHYPCFIDGVILQDSTEYKYSINSGAWFTISSYDTTWIYGSFKNENNIFFNDSAWIEYEIKEEN